MERSGVGIGQAPADGVLPPWAETVQVGVFERRRAWKLAVSTGKGPFALRCSRVPVREGTLDSGEAATR